MKVLISSSRNKGFEEVRALQALSSSDKNSLGHRHICHLVNNFTHSGPNGDHLCIVLESMGVNLSEAYTSFNRALPLALIKRVCVHILSALQYMHDACGIIHTGKLVLLQLLYKL